MKKILLMLSLLVIGLFLIGCAKSGEEGLGGEAVKIGKVDTKVTKIIDCNPCNSVYSQCTSIVSLEEGQEVDLPGDYSYKITMQKVDSKTADIDMTGSDIDDYFGNVLTLGKLEEFGYQHSQIILLSTNPIKIGGKPVAKICIINKP